MESSEFSSLKMLLVNREACTTLFSSAASKNMFLYLQVVDISERVVTMLSITKKS